MPARVRWGRVFRRVVKVGSSWWVGIVEFLLSSLFSSSSSSSFFFFFFLAFFLELGKG